jgi:hypothetical protein
MNSGNEILREVEGHLGKLKHPSGIRAESFAPLVIWKREEAVRGIIQL